MKKYRLPIIFFSIAVAMGAFLRWQYINPTPGVNFRNVLHGHSHLMFSGWVLNVLLFAFIDAHIRSRLKTFNLLLITLQACTIGMLIAFPMQGYGLTSIIFSTLHTLVSVSIIIFFFRQTKSSNLISLWFAKLSMIFFLISTIGPFSLGYLSSHGLNQSCWYNYSIYFYLHFQYNGCFTFGILSLFYELLENKKISFDYQKGKTIGMILALSCLPAFLLSILYNKPGIIFNIIGGLAAAGQIVAFDLFQKEFRTIKYDFISKSTKASSVALYVVLFALGLKLFLQFISAFPSIAELTNQLRPVVIAYIHLMLIGVVSFFLILFMIEKKIMDYTMAAAGFKLLLFGFIGSELCQILVPWWSKTVPSYFPTSQILLLGFSIVLLIASIMLVVASFRSKRSYI
jgi:hypothetical protein